MPPEQQGPASSSHRGSNTRESLTTDARAARCVGRESARSRGQPQARAPVRARRRRSRLGRLAALRVVLARPREPGNVGAAARAVANMDLGELVVVRDLARSDPTLDPRARARAAGAYLTLEAARVVDRLETALAGCVLVAGLTSRRRVRRQPALVDLERAVPMILEAAARGPVALLLGPEDKGLSNDDLAACGLLVRIESSPRAPVLNLAGALLIAGYALRREVRRAPARGPNVATALEPLATVAELEMLYALCREILVDIRFLCEREAQGMITLRGIAGRSRLEAREYRFLMGALRQLARHLRLPHRSRIATLDV